MFPIKILSRVQVHGHALEMLVRTNPKVLHTLAQIPKHCLAMTDLENIMFLVLGTCEKLENM